jgi:hypothetical protein
MTYSDSPLLAHAPERDSTPAMASTAQPGLIAAFAATR